MENDADQLDMPQVKEVRPYVLRHSLSDAGPQSRCHALGLRRLHAAPLKHSAIGEYPTVVTASESIISDLEAFAPGALRRNRAGTDQPCTLDGVGKCRHNNDLEWCAYRTHIFRCRPQKISGFCQRRNSWPPRGPHQIRSHFWRRTCVDWDTVHCI